MSSTDEVQSEKPEPESKGRKIILSEPAKAIVRHITEGIRRTPKSWAIDALPYSDRFEQLLDSTLASHGAGYVRQEVARESIAEVFRRRKSGRLKGKIRLIQGEERAKREAAAAERRAKREAAIAKAKDKPRKRKSKKAAKAE